MPLYDYKCGACNEVTEHVVKYDDMSEIDCQCGGKKTRQLTTSYTVVGDFEPYFDENLSKVGDASGTWVKSKQHRKRLMREYGLTENYGKGWE